MGNHVSKLRGRADEIAAKIKAKLGEQAGRVQEVQGGEAVKSRLVLRAQSAADTIVGSVKEGFGRATGNKRYVIEGKQQKLKGQTLLHAHR